MIRIYFWRISTKDIPWAITQMALNRRVLNRNSHISFWKLLGTGKGETFTPRDADSRRWGLLVKIEPGALRDFEDSPMMKRWGQKSMERFAATLTPLSVHGSWSSHTPFDVDSTLSESWKGEVAALTRARIKWRKNLIFWRSVPPVTTSLRAAEGLVAAIGIGEAPLGLQGTFSIWQNPAAVKEFAYRGSAHREAIAATKREEWYAEELFARFAITDRKGDL